MGFLHRIGKFYTRVIMNNIGIFIFIGLLSVVFGDCGWFPNEDIYAFSEFSYKIILPIMIAFESGRETGGKNGGIPAVITMSGLLVAGTDVGILGAMLIGPFAGFVWKHLDRFLEKKADYRLKMLAGNLGVAVTGGFLAVLVYFLLIPILELFTDAVYAGVHFFVAHRMTGLLSIVIEPAKVLFLNNLVNHAVLVPLGMKQLSEYGSSVLFLLEANPGPGFGLLLALFLTKKKNRGTYASAMFAQTIGGIHEVYFPFVLSDMRLLFPLILGGAAGNLCFQSLGAGVQGMVSPGSVFIVLLMAGKEHFWSVFAGAAVSAIVSFALGILLLRKGTVKEPQEEAHTEEKREMLTVKKIAFVCDGGFGSSAMGAALMRRMLNQKGMEGIHVEAYAAECVPDDADLIICQKDFYPMLPKTLLSREVHQVENLLQAQELEPVIEKLQKGNG